MESLSAHVTEMHRVVWPQAQLDPAAQGPSGSISQFCVSFILRPTFFSEVAKWLLKAPDSSLTAKQPKEK